MLVGIANLRGLLHMQSPAPLGGAPRPLFRANRAERKSARWRQYVPELGGTRSKDDDR